MLLADRRLRQRDYLLRIARAMSERLDLREVLSLVIRYAVEITAGQAGAVAMRGSSGSLEVAASYQVTGAFQERVAQLLSSGLPAAATPASPRTLRLAEPYEQVVALPLELGGETIGQIYVFRSEGAAAFTPLDNQLLAAFAEQAAAAIQNARLYEELSLQAGELERLHDLSLAALKARSRQEALQAAAQEAVQSGGFAWAAAISLTGDEAAAATSGAPPTGPDLDPAELVPASRDASSLERPAVFTLLQAGHNAPPALVDAGFASAAAVAIPGSSSPHGAIWAAVATMDAPDAKRLRHLETVARTLGLALDKFRALEELSARRRQLQAVIQSHPSGILLTDDAGRIRAANRAAAQLLGGDPGALVGIDLQAAIALEEEVSHRALGFDLPAAGQRVTVRGFLAGDGRPYVQLSIKTLGGEAGRADGLLAELVDLSSYKQAEDAKSAFLAGLSHELKTPLSLIRGYAETLEDERARSDPKLVSDALAIILDETGHLTRLVDELLSAAR
jgi:PAS domain S-box-containing protein